MAPGRKLERPEVQRDCDVERRVGGRLDRRAYVEEGLDLKVYVFTGWDRVVLTIPHASG